MAKMAFQLPQAASVVRNPAADELQQLAARMPTARWTKYGNVNVQTEVLARSTWRDPEAYERKAAELARMFVENFEKFDAPADVAAAGPRA